MDATHGTTVWRLPLMLWSVVDNHHMAQLVALGFVQSENGEQIAALLKK